MNALEKWIEVNSGPHAPYAVICLSQFNTEGRIRISEAAAFFAQKLNVIFWGDDIIISDDTEEGVREKVGRLNELSSVDFVSHTVLR